MQIQSLSIVVPTERCVNDFAFCVSKQHYEEYGKNRISVISPEYDRACTEYKKRMEFARDNFCNNVILTGDGEPTQNRSFLALFGALNNSLEKPFRKISIQTAGAFLDANYLKFLRDTVGVSTVSLSISAPDDYVNAMYTGNKREPINIKALCNMIKEEDLNLRLSMNMTDAWNNRCLEDERYVFNYAEILEADAITFRVLYADGDSSQAKWISKHRADDRVIKSIQDYIRNNGRPLETLEFGQTRYDVHGMSTVLDDDCMSTVAKRELKYLILRPNCHLYTKWDSKASLLF